MVTEIKGEKGEPKKFGNIKKILEENKEISKEMLEDIKELNLSKEQVERIKYLAKLLTEVHNPLGIESILYEYNKITGRDF